MKTWILWGIAAALLSRGAAGQERAGCELPPNPDSIVQIYAPVLRFAPNEQFFPTLPFFSALDGRDNDDDGLIDLEDSTEIAPTRRDSRGRLYIDVSVLDRYYLNLVNGAPQHRTALYYRVRCLTHPQRRSLRQFLRNDGQAWIRFGMARFDSIFNDTTIDFAALEYYAYYLRDGGLAIDGDRTGHLHDTEKFFVFVPYARAGMDSLPARRRFRVIVGAGHTAVVPNNVLVIAESKTAFNADIMVELGGHSSAPDLPPRGSFRRGWDTNWYSGEDGWGTRDVQAASGRGYANDWEDWKAFPRDDSISVSIAPPSADGKASYQYLLIPDTLLRAFVMSAAFGTLDSAGLRTYLTLLRPYLGSWWEDPQRIDSLLATPALLAAALQSMRHWQLQLMDQRDHRGSSIATRLWPRVGSACFEGDEDYVLPPTAILKRYLYRRGGLSIVGPEISYDAGQSGSTMLGIGGRLPINLGPYAPGAMQLLVGVRHGRFDSRFALGALLDGHYYRRFSHYFALEWVPDRAEIEQRRVGDLTARAGVVVRLPVDGRRSASAYTLLFTKIRIGARINMHDWNFDMSRVTPEIGFAINFYDFKQRN